MQTIDRLIHEATDAPVGTVIHVGAGRGAVLEPYARLAPKKVVLVEGDPDTAFTLQRAARAFPWAQVVSRAAAAADGDVAWNRYNLPMLNGPTTAEALARHYPRLHREEAASVPGVALSGLLRTALQDGDAAEPGVLVLDVPGQEAALLESLGDELGRVSAVIVRRCAVTLPGSAPWPEVLERMRERGFELVGHEADGEPLWPVAFFRFDRRRHEEAQVRKQIDALRARLTVVEAERDAGAQQMAALREAQAKQVEAQAKQVEALKAEKAAAEKLAAESEASVQALTEAREEQGKQIEALTAAKGAAEKLAAEREASVQALTKARDEQAKQVEALTAAKAAAEKLAAEREASVQQLAKASEDLSKQIEALTAAKAAAEKLATEREASVQQATKAREELSKQIEPLTAAKGAAEMLAAEREASVQALTKARDEQGKQVAALTAAKGAAEKLAAEREVSVQELTKARDEQARQIEELTSAKAVAEKLAAEREASVQQLTKARSEQLKQIDALNAAKDAAEKRAAERQALVQALSKPSDKQLEKMHAAVPENDRSRQIAQERSGEVQGHPLSQKAGDASSPAGKPPGGRRDEKPQNSVDPNAEIAALKEEFARQALKQRHIEEALEAARASESRFREELASARSSAKAQQEASSLATLDLIELQNRYWKVVALNNAYTAILQGSVAPPGGTDERQDGTKPLDHRDARDQFRGPPATRASGLRRKNLLKRRETRSGRAEK